jgi:hypothetical protein
MRIVNEVTKTLQGLLDETMDAVARETGCVKRERKFSGSTLVSTLVLTVLQEPKPTMADYQATAAQLNVHVTEYAILQRFTPELVKLLDAALQRVVTDVLMTTPPPIELLSRFTQVVIGDSTTVTLPDEYADRFPGCGGSHDSGKAAMKIQVLLDLRSGRLEILLEPGRASDAKSPITEIPLPAGSLSIFDLGYFSIERFDRVQQAEGYWLSRLQHGTTVYDAAGEPVELLKFLAKHASDGIVDVSVQIGGVRMACRLLAVRVSPEIASQRRRRARKNARDHGRESSQEYLKLLGWTIYVTNCGPTVLNWKEVVVLYRARWQIERLFKLWKSFNGLADHNLKAIADQQLAEVYAKLIGVIIQHRILLMTVWLDGRRSLWRAAESLRRWMGQLIAVIGNAAELRRKLHQYHEFVTTHARTHRRRKHPSCYQLLDNPELLEYNVA